jgi:hypothetical protein
MIFATPFVIIIMDHHKNYQNNRINLMIKLKVKLRYHVDTFLRFIMTRREINARFIAPLEN